jgi:HK97 family phage major capsid protein
VRDGGDNLAVTEDLAMTSLQVGPAYQPYPILGRDAANANLAGIATVDVAGTTAHPISNTPANAGSAPKLLDLIYALPDQYQANARWMMRAATEHNIRGLLTAAGDPWYPLTDKLTPQGERAVASWPIATNAAMDADGAANNWPVLFGDLSGYVLATRQLLSVAVDSETHGDTDQVLFVLIDRVSGSVANPDAFRLGVVL